MSRSFRGVVLRNGCCPNSAGPNLGQQPFRYIQQSAVPDTVQRNIEGYKTIAVSNLGQQKWDGTHFVIPPPLRNLDTKKPPPYWYKNNGPRETGALIVWEGGVGLYVIYLKSSLNALW